jgi:signal transduction histidine kinase
MKRFRYRQFLMLVALILPSVVITALGWKNFKLERDNTQERATAAIYQALLSKLESIKVGALAEPSTSAAGHLDPAVILVASVLPEGSPEVLKWEFPPNVSDNRVQELVNYLQTDFRPGYWNEEYWTPFRDTGIWLSMTPSPRGSTQPLVIAVRGGDIVQRVREERESSGVLFRISPGDTAPPNQDWRTLPLGGEIAVPPEVEAIRSGAARSLRLGGEIAVPPGGEATLALIPSGTAFRRLGERFPAIWIFFPQGGQGTAAVKIQEFYAVSLLVVVALTMLGWYLLFRDTLREAHLARLRSQFVSSVSHELKTPLTAIRMFAETLQMRGSTEPQIQREFLNTIVNESERLTRLLNNVLDFSRIERGQRNYHLVPTPLTDVVQSAARTMQFPLSEQGFDFQVDVCDGLPPMHLDRDALEQAILNLLSNAMKYSGDSRVIALTLRSEKDSAVIEVVDQGIGIAPEERKRIFETFYRVSSSENSAISGTGLGLALVAHTAEAHGGGVEVESTPGKGSTFSIRIPFNGNGHA